MENSESKEWGYCILRGKLINKGEDIRDIDKNSLRMDPGNIRWDWWEKQSFCLEKAFDFVTQKEILEKKEQKQRGGGVSSHVFIDFL